MVSGLFFGLAFGMGGIGAALLGRLADAKGIEFVYQVCAFLPAIGLLTAFLPSVDRGTATGGDSLAGSLLYAAGGRYPRRSRFDGLPSRNASKCGIAFRSSASFSRDSRLASVSR